MVRWTGLVVLLAFLCGCATAFGTGALENLSCDRNGSQEQRRAC
jgi:hypothetical protein